MDWLLYTLAFSLTKFLQSLPLLWVARLGRAGGALAYRVDGRHRRVAINNLTNCFGKEMTPREIEALARENIKRLGETYCCAIKTASMGWEELRTHIEFGGLDNLPDSSEDACSRVMAIGHFGNFELYARANQVLPRYQFAATYRALKQPAINRLMIKMRTCSGCLIFERRQESEALRFAMSHQRLLLGLLSDQNAGTGGVWIPFFGQLASTTAAPALFAQRYKAPLHTAICFRTSLARWRIEVGPEIPIFHDGQRRSPEEIMLDVNRAFETAIRRDPANWFWVHKRWKPEQYRSRKRKHIDGQPPAPVQTGG